MAVQNQAQLLDEDINAKLSTLFGLNPVAYNRLNQDYTMLHGLQDKDKLQAFSDRLDQEFDRLIINEWQENYNALDYVAVDKFKPEIHKIQRLMQDYLQLKAKSPHEAAKLRDLAKHCISEPLEFINAAMEPSLDIGYLSKEETKKLSILISGFKASTAEMNKALSLANQNIQMQVVPEKDKSFQQKSTIIAPALAADKKRKNTASKDITNSNNSDGPKYKKPKI